MSEDYKADSDDIYNKLSNIEDVLVEQHPSLRDYFAGKALAGLVVHAEEPYGAYVEALAAAAYGLADAMLAARESTPAHN
jgi:hypothetical protein